MAILTFLFAIFAVIGGIVVLGLATFGLVFGFGQISFLGAVGSAVLLIILGIVAFLAGAGLWGLRMWAWWLTLIVGLIQIVIGALSTPIGYFSIGIWAIIVIYLVAVRKAFVAPPSQPTMT